MSLLSISSGVALEQLIQHPKVKAVYEDRRSRWFLNQSLPLIEQPEAEAVGVTGSGTAIAILDSGVDYTLSTFGSCTSPGVPADCKVVYAADIALDDGELDNVGHGTNVAGIALGVAPGADIVALDVGDEEGVYDSDAIAAINWVIQNRATYNIVAINLSFGIGSFSSPCSADVYATPISQAKSAGILVAAASGNDSFANSMTSPACVPAAVSVGAVYDEDQGSLDWGSVSITRLQQTRWVASPTAPIFSTCWHLVH